MNTARSLTADIHGGDTGPRDIARALSEYRLRRRSPPANGDDPGPQGPSAA